MRLTVSSYQSGTVDTEYDRKLLQTYIHQNLVIGSLQKRGIDRYDRFQAG